MLPIRTNLDDATQVCVYLATKATGATTREITAAIGDKYADTRKISALKYWSLVEEAEGRLKVTEIGRRFAKGDSNTRATILGDAIRAVPAYLSVVERATHRHETSISATEVAAHWHDHFKADVSDNDQILNEQAVCFFYVASGANLGGLKIGRRGAPTRFDFDEQPLQAFVGAQLDAVASATGETAPCAGPVAARAEESALAPRQLGQAIFIAHGKNKVPLEQLKGILDQFRIPYRVAVDEPNLGRPIGAKVRQTMDACNCAILIFTADEQSADKNSNPVWRPSQNVVYELGAAGYLYGNRIVVMKEDGVDFPSDFRDIGYISFARDQLAAKSMDIIKELIGFGIVKVST
jgi:predicted nucleotide-binding protein